MVIISKGVTRIVILIGSIAIKIPKFGLRMKDYKHSNFLQGCLANWKERQYFKYFPDSKLVIPSLWCSWFGLIQIQRRARPLGRELTKAEIKCMKKVCSDIKPENFGVYDSYLVCLDYGD